MPRHITALAAVAILAACAPQPQPGWTRLNTSPAAFDMDATACRVEAAQRIPPTFAPQAQPAPQVTVNVGTQRPGPQFATAPADPAYMPPADRSAGARGDAFRLCMLQRGYTIVHR